MKTALIAAALLLPGLAYAQEDKKPETPEPPEVIQQVTAEKAQQEAEKDLADARKESELAQQESEKAQEQARKELEKAMVEVRKSVADVHADPQARRFFMRWNGFGDLPDVRVNLDFDNAPVRDVLKQVFAQAKQEYTVDTSVPTDARVTLHVKNVKLGTALDLITDAAGVRWTREMRMAANAKEPRSIFRVGKQAHDVNTFVFDNAVAPIARALPGVDFMKGDATRDPLIWIGSVGETRSTFTCPHCKRQATVLRQRQQPKCPKCGRLFRSDWDFCPFDGAKRPPSPGAWKFCPMCGKPVDQESAGR